MTFERSVFVNCPFDEDYVPLLRPLLFTIIYLGFEPRIALEQLDSGTPRIQKILNLITSSRFAIHDLSRLQAQKVGEFYRLNMPFELGLDVGCRHFGSGDLGQKRCLILEAEPYRYQAALSDLSNSDIAVHGGSPERITAEVRNWLTSQANLQAPGPTQIWGAFLDFQADNFKSLTARGFSDRDVERLPISELMQCMQQLIVRPPHAAVGS